MNSTVLRIPPIFPPILQVQYVSLNQLFSMAKLPSMVRTGATENPDVRRKAYVYQDGYSGVMYLAETTNMQHTEDQLLQQQDFRDNIQQTSNKAAAPGYVYLINEGVEANAGKQ